MDPFSAFDHVQLAMPAGEEDRAREFYIGVLGLREMRKPSVLDGRGGVWLTSGTVQIHLGVDPEFRPAKKAHPALRCSAYDELLCKIRSAGVDVHEDPLAVADGSEHAYVSDPFGNRIELIGGPRR